MKHIIQHRIKIMMYMGIALISFFILMASLWYKGQYLKEVELTVEDPKVVTDNQNQKTNIIKRETEASTIEVEYPTIPLTFEGAIGANEFVKNIYNERVALFEKEVQESLANDNLPQEFKNSGMSSYFDISYTVVASSSRYISFLVNGESFFIGSAHPSHTIDTFIFDIKNKKLVSPSELFAASSSYLETLSRLTRSDFDIKNKGGDAESLVIDTTNLNDGFNPTTKNFSKMLPTKDGLVIYFDEYQIAPYVAGPQQSLIPYAVLQQVITKDGVLSEYIK